MSLGLQALYVELNNVCICYIANNVKKRSRLVNIFEVKGVACDLDECRRAVLRLALYGAVEVACICTINIL